MSLLWPVRFVYIIKMSSHGADIDSNSSVSNFYRREMRIQCESQAANASMKEWDLHLSRMDRLKVLVEFWDESPY